MKTCVMTPVRTSVRKTIAIVGIVLLVLSFWFLSRYPDLIREFHRTENNSLLNRQVGVLSKDAMLAVHGLQSPMTKIWHATLNWLDTNKVGMSFGFLFSAAILLLIEQSQFFYRRAKQKGILGVLSGLILGMPLGVCTNCATPVALGLKKSGASDESAFSTLIASPSLNPIGLIMIFMLFPVLAASFRIAAILLLLFCILPLFSRTKYDVHESPTSMHTEKTVNETFFKAIAYCARRYGFYLKEIVIRILPIMICVGLIAAILLTYFPLEQFVLSDSNAIRDIVLAAIIGCLLPMPMFVDIILVWMFYSVGLSLAVSTTLLITLAPTSILALIVMGRNVSWRLSIALMVSIALLGMAAGLTVHYLERRAGQANVPNKQGVYFTPSIQKTALKPVNNDSLDRFIGSGVSMIDFNKDGHLDVFVAGDKRTQLLMNDGRGALIDVTQQSGLPVEASTVAGIWGDFNNDGYPDVFLVNYRNEKGAAVANKLYRNNGDGSFTDVSKQMGFNGKTLSASASWADYNNDGRLDLFVANYGKLKVSNQRDIHGVSQHDRLYRNEGTHFVEVAKQAGVAGEAVNSNLIHDIELNRKKGNRGFSFQPIWFDYNNDNLIDLYVSADFGAGQLYRNKGDGTFDNVTQEAGLGVFGTGMGVAVMDLNHDGFFDLFVTTGEENQVWINKGNGTFNNNAKFLGMSDNQRFGWGVAPIDFDNTGELAFFIVNGQTMQTPDLDDQQQVMAKISNMNSFFVKNKKGQYRNFNRKYHLNNAMVGRGLAVGDLDNDGDIDLAISNRDSKGELIVYRNTGSRNHSLIVALEGDGDVNRMAIGTRVAVTVGDKVYHKVLTAGSSYMSQHSPLLHFGVGNRRVVKKVEIIWPNGITQIFKNVSVDKPLKAQYLSDILE